MLSSNGVVVNSNVITLYHPDGLDAWNPHS